MLELAFAMVVVGTIWFIRKCGLKLPQFSGVSLGDKKLNPGPKVWGVIAMVTLFIFWEDISSIAATWFAQSDAGVALGAQKESVQSWLWVPGVILTGWLLFRLFKPKGNTSKRWEADRTITAIGDTIFLWMIGLVIGVVILGITALVLDIFGVPKMVSELPLRMSHASACTRQKEAWNAKIDHVGRLMVVCPEEGPLYVFPEKGGGSLAFDFSEEYKAKHKDVLRGRRLDEFVHISAPGEYKGHVADAWRIIPLQSQPSLKYVSAWDKSGLKDISIVVRATN